MEISSPYAIHDYSMPGSAKPRLQVAQVSSLRTGKKRHEAVVCHDKNGISILSLRESRQVTSYLVSSDTSFTCPPISLVDRTDRSHISRYTYASIQSPDASIVLIEEETGAAADAQKAINKAEFKLPGFSPAHVVSIIFARGTSGDGLASSRIVASLSDGHVVVLTADLRTTLYSGLIADHVESFPKDGDSRIEVEYVALVERARAAQQKPPKGVNTVLNDPSAGQVTGSAIDLAVIGCAPGKRHGKARRLIYTLQITTSSAQGTGLRMTCLQTSQLPIPSTSDIHFLEPQYHLNSKRNQLLRKAGRSVSTIDLEKPGATCVSEMNIATELTKSWLPLKNSISITTSPGIIAAYSTKYCSLLASQSDAHALSLTNKKRKLTGEFQAPETLLCFIDTGLNVAIAQCAGRIVAIPYDISNLETVAGLSSDPLITSIGRGVPSSGRDPEDMSKSASQKLSQAISVERLYSPHSPLDGNQQKAMDGMHSAGQSGQASEFDAAFFSAWGVENRNDSSISDSELLQVFPRSAFKEQFYIGALGALFSLQSAGSTLPEPITDTHTLVMSMRCVPRLTLRWMLASDVLSLRALTMALRSGRPNSFFTYSMDLVCQHFLNTLEAEDGSSEVLIWVLASNMHLPLSPVIDSAAYLIGLLRAVVTDGAVTDLFSDGNTRSSRRADDSYLPSPPLTTTNGGSPVPSEYTPSLNSAQDKILLLYLRRILGFPPSVVIAAMRDRMGPPRLLELLGMMHHYVRHPMLPLHDPETPSDDTALSQDEVCQLIAHALDSLGTQHFNSLIPKEFHELSVDMMTIVSNLRVICATVSEDAIAISDLESAISGVETYAMRAKLSEKQMITDSVSLSLLHTDQDPARTAPWGSTIRYHETDEYEYILPIGLKQENWLSEQTVNAGGELKKRSKREFANRMIDNLPAYSVERICI